MSGLSSDPSYPKRRLRLAGTLAFVAIAYVVAGRLGLAFAVVNPAVTAVWPAAGIAIAALLLVGMRAWVALAIGSFITGLLTLQDVLPSACIAAGNTIEYVLAAALARRFARGRLAFERAPDIFRFTVLSALAAPMVAATVGTTTLHVFGRATGGATIWLTWWLGDATGIMLFTPLCVLWAVRKRTIGPGNTPEAVALGVSVAAVLYVVFGVSADLTRNTPLAVGMIPILLWSAFRFSLPATALLNALLSAIAVYRIHHQFGPFLLGAPSVSLLAAQGFVSVVSLLMLSVSAEVNRRRRGERRLRLLNKMLERRIARRTDELERLSERLVDAQALGHVGSWEWDITNEKLWWSAGMCRLFGVEAAPENLRTFLTLVHPDDRASVSTVIDMAKEGLPYASIDYRIVKPDGEVRVLHGSGRVEVDPAGHHARMIGVCHDVSDRKKAEEQRAQLIAEQARVREVEAINRAKDTFLASLSHELRTPLNVALGWAAVLRKSGRQADSSETRAVEVIYRNLMVQWHLVSDIMDLSQIVTGQLVLEWKPVDVSRVFTAAVDMLRHTAVVRGVTIDIRSSGAQTIMGDARRLEQVAWNLLSNAVKFASPNGRVTVVARGLPDSVECTVEDDGAGIDEGFMPHVFERFRQGNREHGGLGLGMSIAHDIVTMHHGTITAGNHAPHGAVFVVRLPRGVAPEATRPSVSTPGANAPTNKPTGEMILG